MEWRLDDGSRMNRELLRAVLRERLGVQLPGPTHPVLPRTRYDFILPFERKKADVAINVRDFFLSMMFIYIGSLT